MFLLDSSGSIDLNEWNLTLTFVNRIIDAFTIGPQDTQVANIATCVFGGHRLSPMTMIFSLL